MKKLSFIGLAFLFITIFHNNKLIAKRTAEHIIQTVTQIYKFDDAIKDEQVCDEGPNKKYRKLINCTCSIQISITGITWCKGHRYDCRKSGFELCTASEQETPCDCDCK